MIYKSSSIAFLLRVAASPATTNEPGENTVIKGITIDANFDNLAALPGPTTEIGQYKSLNYQGLVAVSQGVASVQVAGVKPHSKPNAAASSVLTKTEFGNPMITANSGEYFDLFSFYFGCVDFNANSISSIPRPCNVTMTGYYGLKQVAAQRFSFKPDNAVLSNPMLATLSKKFKHLDKVTIDYVLNVDLLDPSLFSKLPVAVYLSADYKYVVYGNKH